MKNKWDFSASPAETQQFLEWGWHRGRSAEFFRYPVGTLSELPQQTLLPGINRLEVACQLEQCVSHPCRAFSLPWRPPAERRSQELFGAGFHSSMEGPGRRRQGLGQGPRWPRPAGASMLSASPRALSWFLCSLEAPYSSLRSKLSREEAMAKARGRLYLCMCLAAALASFLAGFMVGKCANPRPQPRAAAALQAKWGWAVLASSGLLSSASVRDCQPNWKHWAFLTKCYRSPGLLNPTHTTPTTPRPPGQDERGLDA